MVTAEESDLDHPGLEGALETIMDSQRPTLEVLTRASRQLLERYEELAVNGPDVGQYALHRDIPYGTLVLDYLKNAGIMRISFEADMGTDTHYRLDRNVLGAYLEEDQ